MNPFLGSFSKPSQSLLRGVWEPFYLLLYIYVGADRKVVNESVGIFPLVSMGTAPKNLLKLMAGNLGLKKAAARVWDVAVALTPEHQSFC